MSAALNKNPVLRSPVLLIEGAPAVPSAADICPPATITPLTSRIPLRSTVVAVISTSVSASMSNCPSVLDEIFKALSLNVK